MERILIVTSGEYCARSFLSRWQYLGTNSPRTSKCRQRAWSGDSPHPSRKYHKKIRRYVMSKYDLTPEEQKIEEHADELVSVSGEERAEVESIIEHARKNRPVNLPTSESTLE